jgi:GNAT superfamily N-acetyltransferase
VDVRVVRYSEQPGLWDRLRAQSAGVWPEYNTHGDVMNQYFGRLYDDFPDWQFALVDTATGEAVAEGHSIPVPWDGTDAGLGPGIDAVLERGFALRAGGGAPGAVSALAAEILPPYQGQGLSPVLLRAMGELGRAAGLPALIAPIRPVIKHRYPTIPIEAYAAWTRADGAPVDPWLRLHVRIGGRIGPVLPRSLHITGTVADWETWTEMAFPESGDYVFPDGLAPLRVDTERDLGDYWEPNIWVIHPLAG